MKQLCTIILAAILCTAASAQNIRTLGYNSTNGKVVYNGTNPLTFTNELNANEIIATNISAVEIAGRLTGQVRIVDGATTNAFTFESQTDVPYARAGLGFSTNLNTLWTATNASNARSAVGLGATWLTNTNVTNFRTAIGLGASNNPTFSGIYIGNQNQGAIYVPTNYAVIEITAPLWIGDRGSDDVFQFEVDADAAIARTNLGLPLAALTNTSNVAAVRAMAGSTNTNEPYSGTVSLTNTNVLTFSNGVLLRIQ